MTSRSRAHAFRPSVLAPLLVEAVPTSMPGPSPVPEVAERVSARAHAAGALPGVALVPSTPDEDHPAAGGRETTDGIRFLGAGWAADAALFAQYRRRSN